MRQGGDLQQTGDLNQGGKVPKREGQGLRLPARAVAAVFDACAELLVPAVLTPFETPTRKEEVPCAPTRKLTRQAPSGYNPSSFKTCTMERGVLVRVRA